MAHGVDHARPVAVVAGGRDDQGAGAERPLADLVEDRRWRRADPGRGAERHRHDRAAIDDRPLNAGKNAAVGPAALVAQHLAGEDLGTRRHPVAGEALRRRRPAAGPDAVRAVTVTVLHRLPGNEALRLDRPRGEVRVLKVHAGIEDRDLDTQSGLARKRGTRDLQAPGELGLAERRHRLRHGLRQALRRLAQQPSDQLVHRLAVAAQVVDDHGSEAPTASVGVPGMIGGTRGWSFRA